MNLQDLLTDEPPFVLRADEAVAAGKRRRRGRQAAALSSAALTVVAVGAGVVLGGSTPAAQAPVSRLGAAPAPATQDTGDLSNPYYAIARAHTPASWTIKGSAVSGTDWWADVDNGGGPDRLGLSRSSGGLQLNPCLDPEFVDGSSCTATALGDGVSMYVRGNSHDGIYSSAYVVIVHPDGSGVEASIDNATWKPIPPGTRFTSADQKRRETLGTVHQPVPIYTTDQLVVLAKALDSSH